MCSPIAIAGAGLAVSAIGTGASIYMGIQSSNAAAAQAQAQLDMQYEQAAQNRAMQREAQRQQVQQQQLQFAQQQRMQVEQMVQAQRQAEDARNLQITQANVQIQNQYEQQRAQVEAEQATIAAKYAADLAAYQRGVEEADEQIRFNNEAANRVYIQEQAKMTEAKQKAAFAAQTALAKSIGAKGAILATGRTGQSIGLLINDAERQAGFAQAQADAQLESSLEQAQIGMDQAFLQSLGANNKAESSKGMEPVNPYMPSFPGIPNFVPFDNNELDE